MIALWYVTICYLCVLTNQTKYLLFMETEQVSVKKIALNYGALWGLAGIASLIVAYVMDAHVGTNYVKSIIDTLIMIAAIVFGLKAFKNANQGYMSLGEALKTGLGISVVAGIIGAVFFYIFISFIDPEMIEKMLAFQREQAILQNPDIDMNALDQGMEMSKNFMQPWLMSTFAILGTLFFGFIVSLIAGLIMKRSNPMA